MKYKLLITAVFSIVLAGCSSFYTTAFRTEQTLVASGHAAIHAYNVYHHTATNGVTDPKVLAQLESQYAQVMSEAKKFGACAEVYNSALESYRVNAADTNKAAVTVAFEIFADESTNIVDLVKIFINPKNPTIVTFSPLPNPAQ